MKRVLSVNFVFLVAISIPAAKGQSNSDSKVASLPQQQLRTTRPPANLSAPPNVFSDRGRQAGDPTVPSPEIQKLLPGPEKSSKPRTPTTNLIPLPKKPKVKLLAIEQSSPTKHGHAALEVDGRSISIELVPRDLQKRTPLPPAQFVDYGAALAQRAALLNPQLDQDTGAAFEMKKYELCLQSSIVLDAVVLNLEQFTDNSIVFNVLPHDELLLVRPEMPQTKTNASALPAVPESGNPLPPIPELKIRGIVLAGQNRGTALLEVGGKSVTIELLPVEKQQRVTIPDSHFAEYRAAIEKRERKLETKTTSDQQKEQRKEYQMSLRCSVVAQGVVFNLEGYSANSLSFRVLPHDETVLLRQ